MGRLARERQRVYAAPVPGCPRRVPIRWLRCRFACVVAGLSRFHAG
jgi:hypothetical protein